jgi:aspartate racemase
MYDAVQDSLGIPMLHIADTTALKVKECGLKKVGLLGTIFTMEQDFYKGRLSDKFSLQVLVPGKTDREIVNRIIFDELVIGNINPESKSEYKRIMANLVDMGAQGIILGCTEIPLLVDPNDVPIPTFDTTYLHAEMAVEIALGERTI